MALPFTTRPELIGSFGMVSSTHWLASQSGMAVLEAGGNAFDAAVATALVLQVVEPHLNGPGGEVPIIGWDGSGDEPFVISGQGVAPGAATTERFADLDLDLVPGTGLLPAVVPGAFGAWMLLLRKWGTMRLRDVMRYAIDYAGAGVPLLPRVAGAIATVGDFFTEHWPSSAEVWLRHGRTPADGILFTNPMLAATYGRIVEEAEAAGTDRDRQIEAAREQWYRGFVAEAVAGFYSRPIMDITGEAHAGLLAFEDLARWEPAVERPVTAGYRGRLVCKAGPWTQGPVFLQQLRLLEGFDLDEMGPASPELIHTVVECAKLAFADREAYYGDPDFVEVPLGDLLDRGYADQRRRLIGEGADGELRPGSPGGRIPRLPAYPDAEAYPAGAAEGIVGGRPAPASAVGRVRGDTCHLDVADRWGNVVAATPSGGWLQSSPAVPGLGFCISTRGQMFWTQPGLPNSIAPGKRPRTTLTPTLALGQDGRPEVAFGTPGGDQQDQWSLLFFLHHVHHGMNLQEAIDSPTWHTRHFASSFYPRDAYPRRVHVEERVGAETVAALRQRGHEVVVTPPWSLGSVSAVGRNAQGLLRAGASPRSRYGYAVGR